MCRKLYGIHVAFMELFIFRRRKLFKCVSHFCYEKASLLVRTRAIQKTSIMPGPSLTLVGMVVVTLTLVVTLTAVKGQQGVLSSASF